MKKFTVLLLTAFMAVSLNLNAQSALDKIFDKYNGQAGFTSVTMNKSMFDMLSRMDTSNEGKEFSKAVSRLESIRILAIDSAKNADINIYKEVMKIMPVKDYKELMSIKENGTDVKFYVLEKGNIISELILIAGGSGSDNALIVIKGDIDLASIGNIAKSMNINGMEQLGKLKEKK